MSRVITAVAAAALLGFASEAHAQACAAFPSAAGQGSVGPNVSFPRAGTGLGVEGSWNWQGPLGFFASFTLEMPDDPAADNLSIFGGGVAYEVQDFVPVLPAWLQVCPVAAVNFSSLAGTTTLAFPLGVGFSAPIQLQPEGLRLVPHVMPQFVLTRISVDEITLRDHNFGIGFGVLGQLGRFYAGPAFSRLFVDAATIDWAIRAGMTFPWSP